MNQYDFIVVGTGIAGLYTALQTQKLGHTLILTKGSIDDCNTKHAQGGIAAAISKKDSPNLHFKDTIAAGGGLVGSYSVIVTVKLPVPISPKKPSHNSPPDVLVYTSPLCVMSVKSLPGFLNNIEAYRRPATPK